MLRNAHVSMPAWAKASMAYRWTKQPGALAALQARRPRLGFLGQWSRMPLRGTQRAVIRAHGIGT
jgi:hypothetical protein